MSAAAVPEIGANVKIQGVKSKPELNGRQGFVERLEGNRVGVQLFVTDIDVRGRPTSARRCPLSRRTCK